MTRQALVSNIVCAAHALNIHRCASINHLYLLFKQRQTFVLYHALLYSYCNILSHCCCFFSFCRRYFFLDVNQIICCSIILMFLMFTKNIIGRADIDNTCHTFSFTLSRQPCSVLSLVVIYPVHGRYQPRSGVFSPGLPVKPSGRVALVRQTVLRLWRGSGGIFSKDEVLDDLA